MNSPKGRRGPLDYSASVRKRPHEQGQTEYAEPRSEGDGAEGRALIAYIPAPVQKRLRGATRRSINVALEIFGGLVIVGILILAIVYGRLNQGPISLKFLVPPIEQAVNTELSGLRFRIGGAVVRKAEQGPGLEFRLKDVSLVDKDGDLIAEAPFASVDLSVSALAGFRFAAEHVDLIGPRLFLQFSEKDGLALAFSKGMRGSTASADSVETGDDEARPAPLRPGSARPWPANDRERGRETGPPALVSATPPLDSRAQSINIAAALGGLFDQIRRSGSASYLTSFGVTNAAVYVGENAGSSEWRVQKASVKLGHGAKGSRIEGEASLVSNTGPWNINFSADQVLPTRHLSITAAVNDVVPRAIAAQLPGLDALKIWNMPLNLEGRFDIAEDGALTSGSASAVLSSGQIFAPWDEKHPAAIDEARVNLEYDRSEGVLRILPSVMRWGASHIAVKGSFRRTEEEGGKRWEFDVGSEDVALAAEEFSLPAIPMDVISIQGSLGYERGDMKIQRAFIKAADAFVVLDGSVEGFNDRVSPSVRLNGAISPMPVAFFKLLWPETVAHGARKWVGKHVHAGRITGGKINVALPRGAISALADNQGKVADDMVGVKLGLNGLTLEYLTGAPPMSIPEATASITGQRFMLDAPDAIVNLPSGENIKLAGGQFIIGDLSLDPQVGEVHFRVQAKAGAALELLDHEPLGYVRAVGLTPDFASGTVSGSFGVTIPMLEDVKFKDMKLTGKAHYQDVRLNASLGGYGLHSGAIVFDLSEKALEAQGEVKINGVPVKLAWQRIFDAPADKQPPLRAAAIFDEAAREALGLPINHVVRGAVPAEAAIAFGAGGAPTAHFEANLTGAEMFVSLVGRRKPPGEKAVLSFDVVSHPDGRVDLDNFKLVGDEIGVTGSISLNEQKKPSAFRFPNFSFNILTKLEVAGSLGDNNVWKVEAHGSSFDGREFFRSLFSAGKLSEDQPGAPKDAPGVDMHAEIDTVLGYFDATMKSVSIDARKRADKLTYLDVHGRLNGSAPMMARVENKSGERILVGEATDAGSAFRLIGFYPAMRGGEASLRVNLDGRGAAEKTGTLYVQNFFIVGDQVVGEVLANTPKTMPAGQRVKSGAARRAHGDDEERGGDAFDQIEFNHLKAPFSVGHGQFVLGEAAINGPLLGATLRGRIDFGRQYVDLSGTYVPLYGINGAFQDFPLLGPLLGGRNGEGVFGITFAIQGSMTRPIQPQINPLSAVAPGFLRQIFEFEPPPARIIPQERKPAGPDVRASSAPPTDR